ncbi:4'-phosphopantetheinyl transferase superfamily protein [Paenibacillus sp. P96]|uniref:4'-phosphopantetheinyl transferase superfamily protein n=1 Tax=Paenibacillus zeirhizosphaerae TaxID=2987519 RepID=A0ABT9FLE5_9BACL|nr:4'-phosphopantetheinyl transferase superfamily protein [Paenibacillus sp. P96]MDP4095543.1 4'-phosphopantetheinyl transferase superfamily protein [Paenibacillus sp. P96]
MMEVFAMDISDEMMSARFERMLSWVSAEKRDRIHRFLRKEDALRSLGAEVLTRWLACNRLGLPNEALHFEQSPKGKPSITGHSGLQFNISHAGKWVVCALDTVPVGIDIEEIRPIDVEVGRLCFSEQEFATLMRQRSETERLSYFYELWTLKESFAKADGRGISLPLKDVTFSEYVDSGIIHTAGWSSPFRYFKKYMIDEGYKAAVAAAHKEFPDTVRFIACGNIDLSLYGSESGHA